MLLSSLLKSGCSKGIIDFLSTCVPWDDFLLLVGAKKNYSNEQLCKEQNKTVSDILVDKKRNTIKKYCFYDIDNYNINILLK